MTTMIAKAVHAIHALEYPGLGLTACEQIVRAVLTAIREPDEAMLDAMAPSGRSNEIVTASQWQDAIDHILAEDQP